MKRAAFAATALTAAAGTLLAAFGAAASNPAPLAAAAAAPRPAAPAAQPINVVLILIDSLRADMPWAGYERQIAPNLTALERESVSYTRGYSVSSYTAKSVAAVLSGQYPSSLKRSGYFFTKYSASNAFFAETLHAAGVSTLATHGHMYLAPGRNGMDQGFDDWRVVSGIAFDNTTDKWITSDKMTPLAIEQLDQQGGQKPFFMYLHYMDPHEQYMKHAEAPDWGKKSRDRYDSEVFYTDLWIQKLLDHIASKPWASRTAIIVSADHGEAFGEHKIFRHAFELWDVLVHVPLFIKLPGATARRIDEPRSAIDLAPTILELLGVAAPPELRGKSLVSELRGAAEPARPVLLDLPADSNNARRRGLVDGSYKLISFGNDERFEIYDLASDPGELHELSKKQPDKRKELIERYKRLWSEIPQVKPFGGNKLTGGGTASGPSE